MRRDIARALTTAGPVTDPQHAALAAELAAAGRAGHRRQAVVGSVIGVPIWGVVVLFLLDRLDEQIMPTSTFLIILSFALGAAIGLVAYQTVRAGRKLAEAERINHALHRMWIDGGSTGTYAKLERASDLGSPGLLELRAAMALSIALVVTVTVVSLFSVGPQALTRLTAALFMVVLWFWTRTALRGVAIVLIVIYVIALIGAIPPGDLGEGAILAVVIAVLSLAVAGLVRSRAYRRALKAERQALMRDG